MSAPNQQHHPAVKLPLSLSIIFGSFTLGFYVAIQGPTLMDLIDLLHVNNDLMSHSMAFASLAYSLGGLLSGFLFNYVDRHILIPGYYVVFGVSNILTPFITNYYIFSVVNFVKMMCAGGTDCGANVWILNMWPGKDAWLQALHFSFAVGCALGPLVVEPFLSAAEHSGSNPDSGLHFDQKGNAMINNENTESRIYIPYGVSGGSSLLASALIVYFYWLEKRKRRQDRIQAIQAVPLAAVTAAGAGCLAIHASGQPVLVGAAKAQQAQTQRAPITSTPTPTPTPKPSSSSRPSPPQTPAPEPTQLPGRPETASPEANQETSQQQLLAGGYQLHPNQTISAARPRQVTLALPPASELKDGRRSDSETPHQLEPLLPGARNTSTTTAAAAAATSTAATPTTTTISTNTTTANQISNQPAHSQQQLTSSTSSIKFTSKAREQLEGRPPYYVMFAIALVSLCLSFYCGIEITSMNYLASFAVNIELQLSKSTAALMSSALTISFAVGRLFGIWIAAYMRPHKLFYSCLAVMALGNVFILIFANTAERLLWTSICLFGIGCGPMYASIVSFYDDKIAKVTNTVSGIFILGSMFNVALNTIIIGHYIIDNALILIVCNLIGAVLLLGLFGSLHALTAIKKNQRKRKFRQQQLQLVAGGKAKQPQPETKDVAVAADLEAGVGGVTLAAVGALEQQVAMLDKAKAEVANNILKS